MHKAAYQPQVRMGMSFEMDMDRNATAVVREVLKTALKVLSHVAFSTSCTSPSGNLSTLFRSRPQACTRTKTSSAPTPSARYTTKMWRYSK